MKIHAPAVFIGRFQPFHLGHLSALKWIAARSFMVVVAIGSAQKSFEPENPFTAKERAGMIRGQLRAAGLARKCAVVQVTDINDNGRWAAHVDASVPRYNVVYSNNALVKSLTEKICWQGKLTCGKPAKNKNIELRERF